MSDDRQTETGSQLFKRPNTLGRCGDHNGQTAASLRMIGAEEHDHSPCSVQASPTCNPRQSRGNLFEHGTEIQGRSRARSKILFLSEDGATAGGVYLWRSREDAERLYTDDWRRFIAEKYGEEPSVNDFATPGVVDNLVGEIITDG